MYLEERPDGYYAILRIPKDVLELYDGKKKLLKKLEANSRKKAQLEANTQVSKWKKEFELRKISQSQTLDNPLLELFREALEIRKQFDAEEDTKTREALSYAINDIAEQIEQRRSKDEAKTFHRIASGLETPLLPLYEEWAKKLIDYEPKTVDSYKRDTLLFVNKFKNLEAVSSKAVRMWIIGLIDDGMTINTAKNRVIKGVRNFWNYLAEREIIDYDRKKDLLDVTPQEKKTKKSLLAKGRDPFTPEELSRIHRALPKDDFPLEAVTTIAMYTGCRIEEICQLKVEGVKNIQGVQCFVIDDSKNPNGYRPVPIHSKLHPIVKKLLKESTNEYLISDLTFNKYDDRSNAVGKRFGKLKTSLGFPKKTKVFHTIRNCVITQLMQTVPRHIVKDLVGHEKADQTEAYTAPADMKTLKKTVELIKYPKL